MMIQILHLPTKTFQTKIHLKAHMRKVHGGHNDHKCESCENTFSEAGTLKKHIHTIHDGHKEFSTIIL